MSTKKHIAQDAADKRVSVLRTKLVMAALGFVDCTLAEMESLEGTESASAPAEFMILHESAEEYREAVKFAEKLRNHG
jgi:hypothetical protein